MNHYLFTSESVAAGHPDKISDQISDAIVDAYLSQDQNARVACETLVTSGTVILAGEISSIVHVDHNKVVRDTIKDIGYIYTDLGFDYQSCGILSSFNQQSPDIALGLDAKSSLFHEPGAGDQGIMFGYACEETDCLMPMPIILAHKLVKALQTYRVNGTLPYLRPDGKSQVTIEYADGIPRRIHTLVLSAQHTDNIPREVLEMDLKALIHQVLPAKLLDDETIYFINPTGRFVIGGPVADCGLTGRKIMVDTYGGAGHHGGGAFSGKDPTKMDRSGSYMARYVAKNIVAAKLASRCEIQLSYAIGYPHPVSIKLDTFGTATVSEDKIIEAIPKIFMLSPYGIIQQLNLRHLVYSRTAFGGHFGREEPGFTWEETNRAEELRQALRLPNVS